MKKDYWQHALLVLSLLFLTWKSFYAQDFEWNAGVHGIADNREYFNDHVAPRTIFGTRGMLELGFSIDSVHHARAGLDYLYEFGSYLGASRPKMILYYHARKNPYHFYMGAFPRENLLDYPLFLLSDTLHYYRPTIQGMYLSYKKNWGHQAIWIDWTSRQTTVEPENFLFGLSGKIKWDPLYMGHHFLMFHQAGPAIEKPGEHLRDNGGADIFAGTRWENKLFFDTLDIQLMGTMSIDRLRGVYGWQTPMGIMPRIQLFYKPIGLKASYYLGEGHDMVHGDGFYQAKRYGRLDFLFFPIRHEKIHGMFAFTMHFIDGQVDYSQRFLLRMGLSSLQGE
jgi:hypothetical protein